MKIEDVSNSGSQVIVSLIDSTEIRPNSPRWFAAAKQIKNRLGLKGEFAGVDLRKDRGLLWAQFSYLLNL